MPQTDNFVHFKRGLQDAYDNSSKDSNTIYFCTNSQRLFVGREEYTRPINHGSELPDKRVPPNSLFIIENDDGSRELNFSADGESWELVSILPKKISGGVFGDNPNLSVNFGDTITIPKIEVNEYGIINGVSNQDIKLPDRLTEEMIADSDVLTSSSIAKEEVVKSITQGELPSLNSSVTDENLTLSFDPGTNISVDKVDVVKLA